MFSKYSIQARIFPAIICAIPVLFFQYFFLSKSISDFLTFLGGLKFIGDITISIVVIYLFSQVNRFISKTFFEKEETYMPTTDFLLFSNQEYSDDFKRNIYRKLENDFGMNMPNEREQSDDESGSRKRIAEAMSLARKKVGSGKLLLQHNIEYGFWRNLIGGSVLALAFSVLDVVFSFVFSQGVILVASIILAMVYLFILMTNRFIIDKHGKLYARVFIQEYMGSSN